MAEYRRAVEDYDTAIGLNPDSSALRINRGRAYEELGEYRRAIEDYDKAIELILPMPEPTSTGAALTIVWVNTVTRSRTTTRPSSLILGTPKRITAGGLPYKLGNNRRAIDDLNKALTLTEDPALRADVENVLAQLQQ